MSMPQNPDTVVGGAIAASLIALALIGLLPRIFFRRGRLNARWWLTASPFIVAGLTLAGGVAGVLTPIAGARVHELLAWAAIVSACGAVALIRWTLHTHARPVSLWHQEDDRPDELVTRGAYAYVRHPFYASFLLALLACALAFPHALTLLALVGGGLQLNRTAAREEERLRAAFGHHYHAYIQRTGRFVPRGFAAAMTGRRGAIPPMAALCIALAVAKPAAGQKVEALYVEKPLVEAVPQSALEDVLLGATVGFYAGAAAGVAVFVLGADEPESMSALALIVLPLLGTPVGAVGGAVVHAFGGDVPRKWRI